MKGDDWDDDPEFDECNDGDLEFDCHMDSSGLCGAAGSEDCEFECPVMASIRRHEKMKTI